MNGLVFVKNTERYMNHRFGKITKKIVYGIIILAVTLGVVGSVVAPAEKISSYIVQSRSAETASKIVKSVGGEVVSTLTLINGVSADLTESEKAWLDSNSDILAITPNGEVQLSGTNSANGGGTNGKTSTDYPEVVGADIVWEQGVTGNGVTVAILDTGIAKLPTLTKSANGNKRLVAWFDAISGGSKPIDPNGHGSHVAGIIANSDTGADNAWNGVAPDVNLVAVRVLDENGYGTYANVISGLQWVVDHKDEFNIRIVNLSLVSTVESPYWADPLNQAVTAAWVNGITVIVAAGNDGPTPMSISNPGNNPYAVTVGAFTDAYTPDNWNDDYIADFSAAGPTLDGFVKPDLVAPGGHIASITPEYAVLNNAYPDNRLPANYFKMAGTSQATAVTSGVAALILSNNPGLTNDQVKYRLTNTALIWLDANQEDALYSMWQQGAGRINAVDAVFTDDTSSANEGMDIIADLAGEEHYEGYSYYDEADGTFKLYAPFDTITGRYGIWSGRYGIWSGRYGIWSGESTAWSSRMGIWSGRYGIWSGRYGIWSGRKGIWSGGESVSSGRKGIWSGRKGIWSGGYTQWFTDQDILAGRKGIWSGRKGIWSGSDFISSFANGDAPKSNIKQATISNFLLDQ